jgi:hypothetical protein
MSTRAALFLLMLLSTPGAATQRRVYAVAWAAGSDRTANQQALRQEVDRRLKDELTRRGGLVVEVVDADASALLLQPTVEELPRGLSLKLVGVRGPQHLLVGAVSTKAQGRDRAAVMKALVESACVEAERLE